MAGEYRTEADSQKVSYYNKPSDQTGYRNFRRIVLHLSTVQDGNALCAEPLVFEKSWTVPATAITPEALGEGDVGHLGTHDGTVPDHEANRRPNCRHER